MKFFICLIVILVFLVGAIPLRYSRNHHNYNGETNAAAALKTYSGAQAIYQKANYGPANDLAEKRYAPSFCMLGGKRAHHNTAGTSLRLLPDVFANATQMNGYQGDYFIDGVVSNPEKECSLFAVPCIYGKTGFHSYWMDQSGLVRMKDLGGRVPTPVEIIDDTWVVP